MEIPTLRLALLQLVHRPDHEPARVIERAKALEAYVLAATKADKGKPPAS